MTHSGCNPSRLPNSDEGFDGTGLTGFTAMCNATTTPTLKPTQVTTGMTTSTVGPDVAKNNGTGSNLNDPSTSTTGLNSITSVNTGPFFNVVNMVPTSSNKNGSEKVGNEPVMNETSSSSANKLSPTSLTKANLRKLKANVPYDVDYDVGLPLASAHEVKDRIKNSLYSYFIGKRLAFSVRAQQLEKIWVKERNDGERVFLFKVLI
ncbi:hypothetical protein Tco_0262102 [Tanacetum coccineum]